MGAAGEDTHAAGVQEEMPGVLASFPVLISGQTNVAVSSAKFPARSASAPSLSGAHKQGLALLAVLSLDVGRERRSHLPAQARLPAGGCGHLRWCCCGTPDKHLACSRLHSCCVCCSCTGMSSFPQQSQNDTGKLLGTRKSRSRSLVHRLAHTDQKHCVGENKPHSNKLSCTSTKALLLCSDRGGAAGLDSYLLRM